MRKIAFVFVSYRSIPEERLQDHFRWNGEMYEAYGDRLRVFVVSDVEHDVPSYATVCVFPIERLPVIGQRRFSLTMTKNFGNQAAIDDGADVIVCTDVDIAFPANRLEQLLSVDDYTANIPVYQMSPSFSEESGHLDHGCTGTVVMTAKNWGMIPYDERCVGYGADDGLMLRDIQRARLRVNRDVIVRHVAHMPGDGVRSPGSGSDTCWGRVDGFNFDNFHENRKLHRR